MNTNHDELERLLGAELHDQVDGWSSAPFGLRDVQGRAGRIRRNRRIAVGVGIAAALAVIVPTAVTVGGSIDRTSKPDPAQPSPGPVEVAETTLTFDGLERGEAPGIEYFTEDGVVLPGEGLQPLSASYQAILWNATGGGWLVLGPARDETIDLTETFERTSARAVTDGIVSNADQSLVASVFPESGAQTLALQSLAGGSAGMTWEFPELPVIVPVDVLSEDSVLYQTLDENQEIGIANADGTTTELEGDFVSAISASPSTGLIAVQTRSRNDGSGCFGVLDPAVGTAEPVWQTCQYSLSAFSPDGRYVMASDAYQSGLGRTSVSVLDAATGDLVASFQQPRRGQIALVGAAWESDDSFLAVAVDGLDTTILRFGVDGTLEDTVDHAESVSDTAYYLGDDRVRTF